MALVANPPTPSVWRDPNLLASPPASLLSSMGMVGPPPHHHHHHHHPGLLLAAAAGGGGLSPSGGLDGGQTSPLLGHAPSSSTPLPPSDISQQSSDSESAIAKGSLSKKKKK
jgi:hypothetical protein